ncbi:MAG: CapA family protein, partial [Candidatus Parcubacteria bacterium]|nr:CapA family protein [Candidatus Parcubacteria bacterium]
INYIGGGFSETEAYTPLIKEIKGIKIAFLAYTDLGSPYWGATGDNSGISWLEKGRMEEDVKKAKETADIVIVSFHYGDEYALEANQFQKNISHTAIDNGADLVIGHHPHVVQPTEKYNNRFIAYSLGNFVFDQGFSEETQKGLLLKILIRNGKIKEIIPIEIKINEYFQPEIIKL